MTLRNDRWDDDVASLWDKIEQHRAPAPPGDPAAPSPLWRRIAAGEGFIGSPASFSPDGGQVAIPVHRSLQLFDVRTGEKHLLFPPPLEPGASFSSVAFSTDGRCVAAMASAAQAGAKAAWVSGIAATARTCTSWPRTRTTTRQRGRTGVQRPGALLHRA